MIRRISIDGYKSLTRLDVTLRPLALLFGPNAVGKSNFLDAIQLLARMVNAPTLKQAFEPPHRGTPLESFTFGPDGIAGHLQKDRVSFTMEVDVELSDATVAAVDKQIAEMRRGNGGEHATATHIKERLLRYHLEVEILPRSGILRVCDESLTALKADGKVKGSRNPFLEKTKDGRLSLRMEGQGHPIYHDTGLDHTLVSRPLYPPHYPHLIAFRQELAGWFCFYFEPRERMRASNPVKEVRHIGQMGEDLASFLNTLHALEPRQFQAVERAVTALIPRIQGVSVEPNKLGEVELNLIEDGVRMPARLVSEGTLRMLGLLAVGGAKEQPTLVAFEEPENGIHPRRLELIAKFLETKTSSRRTQFIVTTHSPLLPDLLREEALFVCSRTGRTTEIRPFQAEGELFRHAAVQEGLEDSAESGVKVSERILRGDFDT